MFFFWPAETAVAPPPGQDAISCQQHGHAGAAGSELRAEPEGGEVERLGPDELAENERELARMKQHLPGNLFLPGRPDDDERARLADHLREGTMLGSKVRSGTATAHEKKRYYELMCKRLRDRIDIIAYIRDRSRELGRERGTTYLDEEDIAEGERTLLEYRSMLSEYQSLYAGVSVRKGE